MVEDLRRTREQIVRADRLGTLGTLAAGLAHEINNPLVSIHTFLSLAQQKRSEQDPEFWGDYHRLACQEVERIRGLVATMSRLGRGEEETVSHSPCDLGDLVREAVLLLAREARAAGVTVDVEVDPRASKVMVARDQLHQLSLNLLLNAIQARAEGGRVLISVRPDGPARRRGVCLEVVDQGCGISEEDLDRIFDPFFTTKGPDQGTGLGLMICHRIVQAHGGTIEVASRPGQGATFRVRLPLSGSELGES
jgi:signal transduction histidine kinase